MTKCCATCKNLDKYHKCTVIESNMLVMIRVLDRDFKDTNDTTSTVHAVIVMDKALETFCCSDYKKGDGNGNQ
ncbi:MAG: hypothetical protein IJU60_04825 [Acholeplasmatales bacterium]|nr:hypothetical protein [Acholeplasmatales bacterium]